jgi:hypothetical protein
MPMAATTVEVEDGALAVEPPPAHDVSNSAQEINRYAHPFHAISRAFSPIAAKRREEFGVEQAHIARSRIRKTLSREGFSEVSAANYYCHSRESKVDVGISTTIFTGM